MSAVYITSLIVASLILSGWLYWLTGRVQRLLTHAEQLQAAGSALLSLVPGKSAPRTEAPPDVVPKRWWGKLIASADARERAAVLDAAIGVFGPPVHPAAAPSRSAPAASPDGEMTVKVALTQDPHPDDTPTDVLPVVPADGEVLLETSIPVTHPDGPRPRPSPGPETRPSTVVIDAWHREVTVGTPAQPDAADLALARFGLRPNLYPASDTGAQPGGDDS